MDKKAFLSEIEYSDTFELINDFLSVYAEALRVSEGINIQTSYLKVLAFYLLHGYSQETKRVIMEYMNKDSSYIANADHKLRKFGFLKKDERHFKKSVFTEKSENLRKYLLGDGVKYIVVRFKKRKD